jgi:four helix bundle protein
MKIERFEELPIWKDARTLSSLVYKNTKLFKDFSLRDQMRRAVVSVVSNIAEGFERGSNKEFIQFLYIAKGSIGELRAQLYVAYDANLLSRETLVNFVKQCEEISKGISKFVGYLRKSSITGERHNTKNT